MYQILWFLNNFYEIFTEENANFFSLKLIYLNTISFLVLSKN